MNGTISKNAPAFPFSFQIQNEANQTMTCADPGMSIRTYAAIAAMQGLLAGEASIAIALGKETGDRMEMLRSPKETADLAVRHADALLEALA